jgi:hypothetical protein
LSARLPREGGLYAIVSSGLLGLNLSPLGEPPALLLAPMLRLSAVWQPMDGIALLVSAGAWSTASLGRVSTATTRAQVAGGLLVAPHAWLLVEGGASLAAPVVGVPGSSGRIALRQAEVTLGSATSRGGFSQPTLELRVLDGLHLYESSAFVVDPGTGRLIENRHAAGMVVYF